MTQNSFIEEMKISLLGQPKITIGNMEVKFPYKKAEALLYYLLLKRRASKEQLGNMFWENTNDEALIKKNLRNAIYIIRKLLGKNCIVNVGNDSIEFNPMYSNELDVNIFLNAKDIEILELYGGDFLEKFNIKDSIAFEEWVEFKRQEYRDIFIDKLIRIIELYIEQEEYIIAKKYCKQLIKMDEYDERSYRLLIDIYKRQGAYNKCINIYKKLENILSNELLISPDLITTELIDEVKSKRYYEKNKVKKHNIVIPVTNHRKNSVESDKSFFYGRDKELRQIADNLHSFLKNKYRKSICIIGEEGIGKTKTVNEVFSLIDESDDYNLLSSQCYKAEEKYLLKPWNSLFDEISKIILKEKLDIPKSLINVVKWIFPGFYLEDTEERLIYTEQIDFLKYQSAEKAIVELLSMISLKKKLIIYIDDFQWSDELSISLIRNIMTNNKNESILFILTSRNNYKKNTEAFILDMFEYELFDKIILNRFTENETLEFAQNVLSHGEFNTEIKNILYKETEGNPFFLVELLNNIKENKDFKNITPKIQDVLKNRIMPVSENGKRVLDILSIFFDRVDYETLEKISLIRGLELVEIIDELIKRNLIVEKGNFEKVYYTFTHQKIREYIYGDMSLSKKRILHNRAGEIIESNLKNIKKDILLYPQLIYHFERCGKKYKVFKYNTRYLYECLQFTHEIFPLVYFKNNDMKVYLDKKITNEQIKDSIENMGEIVNELKDNIESDESLDLISQYLHMVGRFYIRQGEYEKGLEYINSLIMINKSKKSIPNIIKGYRQLICYYINTYQTNEMSIVIDNALEVVKKLEVSEEEAVWWRLKGLLRIMEGEFDEGEKLLRKAIDVFEKSTEREKYISNLAAAYNWIGESKRYVEEYKLALEYYDKAIELNEERGLTEALSVFNTNAGQASFDMNQYENAEKYLKNALINYDKMDAIWCRSLAHSYYGLLLFDMKKYDETIEHLENAIKYAKQLMSPYEIGVFYRVMAEIKYKIDKKAIIEECLNQYFNKSIDYYYSQAKEYLNRVKSPVELRIIEKFLENQ